MTSAFSPGHITCFFMPGPAAEDLSSRGSAGVGIRISAGATASVMPSEGTDVMVFLDGVLSAAPVSRGVVERMLPGRGAVVRVDHDVPVGQGFGMSAAGAVAVALCCTELTGADPRDAYLAAHCAEIAGGGGLGDVSAIASDAHVPVRCTPGFPPHGKVTGVPMEFGEITLVVLGPKMDTGSVLGDRGNRGRITAAGKAAMDDFKDVRTKEGIFDVSNRFSSAAEVESPEVRGAIALLSVAGIRSAMCMLGNSIFAEASLEEVRDVLGDVECYRCSSTCAPAYSKVKS